MVGLAWFPSLKAMETLLHPRARMGTAISQYRCVADGLGIMDASRVRWHLGLKKAIEHRSLALDLGVWSGPFDAHAFQVLGRRKRWVANFRHFMANAQNLA